MKKLILLLSLITNTLSCSRRLNMNDYQQDKKVTITPQNKYKLNITEKYLRTSPSETVDREYSPEKGKCNNFNDRKNGGHACWIMQHHTVSDTEGTAHIFLNGGVSSHYVITPEGEVQYFVDDSKRAYHAGRGSLIYGSSLNPLLIEDILNNDMNSWSIGIENVNNAMEPFTQEQITANIYLMDKLVKEHHIDPKLIIGHADWTPGVKIDPSPYFPWQDLAQAANIYKEDIERNFGIYPNVKMQESPDTILSNNGGKISEKDIQYIQSKLEELGYPIIQEDQANYGVLDQRTRDAILSFKIHYRNQDITNDEQLVKLWEQRCSDVEQEKLEATKYLSTWDENDERALNDVLELYKQSSLGR